MEFVYAQKLKLARALAQVALAEEPGGHSFRVVTPAGCWAATGKRGPRRRSRVEACAALLLSDVVHSALFC